MKSFICLMIVLSMTAVASANHRRTPVRNALKRAKHVVVNVHQDVAGAVKGCGCSK